MRGAVVAAAARAALAPPARPSTSRSQPTCSPPALSTTSRPTCPPRSGPRATRSILGRALGCSALAPAAHLVGRRRAPVGCRRGRGETRRAAGGAAAAHLLGARARRARAPVSRGRPATRAAGRRPVGRGRPGRCDRHRLRRDDDPGLEAAAATPPRGDQRRSSGCLGNYLPDVLLEADAAAATAALAETARRRLDSLARRLKSVCNEVRWSTPRATRRRWASSPRSRTRCLPTPW